MIISMYDVIVISNRKLVEGDYFAQIEKIAKLLPRAIILREKDLSEDEYRMLAGRVKEICEPFNVEVYVHSRQNIARELGIRAIHMSSENVIKLDNADGFFTDISVACHSIEDVELAIKYGATQIILGTIFETDCKKGLKGRGVEFVARVCEYCRNVYKLRQTGEVKQSFETSSLLDMKPIPVYAIGGITPDNLASVKEAGAAGACMMSYMMKL